MATPTCEMLFALSDADAICFMMVVIGHRTQNGFHGCAGVINQLRALLHAVDGISDQPFDLFCCIGTAACEVTDFSGNNCKPRPCSARAASTAALSARMLV